MSLAQRNHEEDEGRKPPGVRLLSAASPHASAPASAIEPIEGRVCFSQNDFISATLETDPVLRLPAAPPAATSPSSPPGAAKFGTPVAMAGPPAASPPSEPACPGGNTVSDAGGCMDSRREGALDVVRDEGALASDAGGRDDLKDKVSLLSEYGCDTPTPDGGTLTLLIGDKLKLTLVSLDWSEPGEEIFSCMGETPMFSAPEIGVTGLRSSYIPGLRDERLLISHSMRAPTRRVVVGGDTNEGALGGDACSFKVLQFSKGQEWCGGSSCKPEVGLFA
jgi:hypothetical protein